MPCHILYAYSAKPVNNNLAYIQKRYATLQKSAQAKAKKEVVARKLLAAFNKLKLN